MKMGKSAAVLCGFFLSIMPFQAHSGELVYQPINPAFGGSPANYSWLLESAQIQSTYEEDPMDNFEKNLNSRILSTLASRIVQSAFGAYGDDLQAGVYQFGDYIITITTDGGITVDIYDDGSGSTTTVSVPY